MLQSAFQEVNGFDFNSGKVSEIMLLLCANRNNGCFLRKTSVFRNTTLKIPWPTTTATP